jgi:hypothetical protein
MQESLNVERYIKLKESTIMEERSLRERKNNPFKREKEKD